MTKKRLLLLLASCWLALAGRPAQAQVPDPAAVADSLTELAEIAHDDTTIAVQRLFFAQRRSSRRQLLLDAVVAGDATFFLALGRPETTYQALSTGGLGLVAGYYYYELVNHIVLLRRFRPKRERQVLESFDSGRPLPAWVRRQLKAKYFSVKVSTY
ncbi:MAG: hypothetical protein ACRYFX_06320 [Janthinobacterium lividum]